MAKIRTVDGNQAEEARLPGTGVPPIDLSQAKYIAADAQTLRNTRDRVVLSTSGQTVTNQVDIEIDNPLRIAQAISHYAHTSQSYIEAPSSVANTYILEQINSYSITDQNLTSATIKQPSITSYVNGMVINAFIANSNTDASTIALSYTSASATNPIIYSQTVLPNINVYKKNLTGFIPLTGGELSGDCELKYYSNIPTLGVAGFVITRTLNVQEIPSSNKNYLINPSFSMFQITSGAFSNFLNNTYTLDNVYVKFNGTPGTRTISRVATTPGELSSINGSDVGSWLRYQRTTLGAGQTFNHLYFPIEDCSNLAGRTVTFSFFAKATTPQTLNVKIGQDYGVGGSTTAFSTNTTFSITATPERFAFTTIIPSNVGKILGNDNCTFVSLGFPLNILYDISIKDMQLEIGNNATSFIPKQRLHLEAECKRYMQKSYADSTSLGTITTEGVLSYFADNVSMTHGSVIYYKPEMRITPNIQIYNPATGALGSGRQSTGANRNFSGMGAHSSAIGRVIFATGATPTTVWITWHYFANANIFNINDDNI